MAITASSVGKGVMPFPPGSPSGSLPLVRAPEVMEIFHHVAFLDLVVDRVTWFG
jgi:hypothetical protein